MTSVRRVERVNELIDEMARSFNVNEGEEVGSILGISVYLNLCSMTMFSPDAPRRAATFPGSMTGIERVVMTASR